MEIRITDVTMADAAGIAALAEELGYAIPAAQVEDLLRAVGEGHPDRAWKAVSDGEMIGWMQVSEMIRLESGRFLEITGLVVTAGYRSHGIGGMLVAQAKQFAKQSGMNRLVVRTNILRAQTQEFYAKQGFKLVKQQAVFQLET